MKYYVIVYFAFIYIMKVETFSWSNCGSPSDPIHITTLDGVQTPPKNLILSGSGKVAFNLTSPIKGVLNVKKKFFWGWTELPCVLGFGSCDYDDVCSLSPYIGKKCPSKFVDNQLPCTCPVLEGYYAAKKFPIDLSYLPKWIEEGYYKIELNLLKDDKQLLCLMVNLRIK